MSKYSFGSPADFGGVASSRKCAQPPARRLYHIFDSGFLGLMLLLIGCGAVTVFQSSFDSNPVGAPPSPNQSTGTVTVSGAPGAVVIVSTPPNATGNWAQIQRAAGPTVPISMLQADFSQPPQNATYSLLAVLLIPSGSGLATVEFDTYAQTNQPIPPSTGFLHVDFGDFPLQDGSVAKNTIRINDSTLPCPPSAPNPCIFPRDRPFTFSANLTIGASSASAHLGLVGAGGLATGSTDISNVTPLALASQFGEMKFYMGFPWSGSFDVTNIIVTRQ
jgi:hypothetical protein